MMDAQDKIAREFRFDVLGQLPGLRRYARSLTRSDIECRGPGARMMECDDRPRMDRPCSSLPYECSAPAGRGLATAQRKGCPQEKLVRLGARGYPQESRGGLPNDFYGAMRPNRIA